MTLENWDDLRFVLAMTRHGTMSAAARFLDTNVATVSRRIDRISQDLGTPLFEKRGSAFHPTHTAERLSRIAEGVDHRLRAALPKLGRAESDAPVLMEIAAPPAVHTHYVMPHTAELAERLPEIRLTLTEKVFAQGLGEADVQIRVGRPEGGRLRARKFRDYALCVFHRADRPIGTEWIGLSHRYPVADALREIHPAADPDPTYRVEEMPMVLDMVRATGLPGLLPDFMVRPEHGLVKADLPGNALPHELWIAYHETRHGDATLRALVDWLTEMASAA